MNKILIVLLLFIGFSSNAQWMKIYANGGFVAMADSANTIITNETNFKFQTNQALSTVTISTDNRKFANYRYNQIKKQDGTNLASSFSDLLVKLGEIQASVSGGSSGGSEVSITPINNTFSCVEKTGEYILAANTYKEITIVPRGTAIYTLQTGSNTAITGITSGRFFSSTTGLITTIITVTPTTGTVDICTKQ